jgi:hypothetical protein
MTQILLHQSNDGIVMATDSRGVSFHRNGEDEPRLLEVMKLFLLSRHVIAVTGGAGYGVLLCMNFQKYVREARLQEFDDIAQCALPFFRSQIETQRRSYSSLDRPDLDRLYVLLAGCIPQRSSVPFEFALLASEGPDDPLRKVETSNVVVIPRQPGFEYRLARLSPAESKLDDVEALFEGFLQKTAALDDDVGPPFHFVRITSNGVEVRTHTN